MRTERREHRFGRLSGELSSQPKTVDRVLGAHCASCGCFGSKARKAPENCDLWPCWRERIGERVQELVEPLLEASILLNLYLEEFEAALCGPFGTKGLPVCQGAREIAAQRSFIYGAS